MYALNNSGLMTALPAHVQADATSYSVSEPSSPITALNDSRRMASLPRRVLADASIDTGEPSSSPITDEPSNLDDRAQSDVYKELQFTDVRCAKTSIACSPNKKVSENTVDVDSLIPTSKVDVDLQFGHFDVLLLHTEEDNQLATEVKEHLETKIEIKDRKGINVLLYRELQAQYNRPLGGMELGLDHCTYVFMLVTAAFVECAKTRFLSEECLVTSLQDPKKRWCFVPVFTSKSLKLPFGLNSLSGIHYDRQDEFYFEYISRMMNQRKHLRLNREEEQKEDILKCKTEIYIKQQKLKEAKRLRGIDASLYASTTLTAQQPVSAKKEISNRLCGKPSENIDVYYVSPSCITSSSNPCETSDLPESTEIRGKQKQDFLPVHANGTYTQNTDSPKKGGNFDASSYLLGRKDGGKRMSDEYAPENANLSDSSVNAENDSSFRQTDQGVKEVHHHTTTYIIQNSTVHLGNKITTQHEMESSIADDPLCDEQNGQQDLNNDDIKTHAILNCGESNLTSSLGLSSVLSTFMDINTDLNDLNGPVSSSTQLVYQDETSSKTFFDNDKTESTPLVYQEETSSKTFFDNDKTESTHLTTVVSPDVVSVVKENGVSSTEASFNNPLTHQVNDKGSTLPDTNMNRIVQPTEQLLDSKVQVDCQADNPQNHTIAIKAKDPNDNNGSVKNIIPESTQPQILIPLQNNERNQAVERIDEESPADPQHTSTNSLQNKKKKRCAIC